MNYWEECISEALDDSGITATEGQIKNIAYWVEGAHDNYGMANGYHCIYNPLEDEIRKLKESHKKELEAASERENCYKKSVARRRNVSIDDVYLEDGDVYYGNY